MKPKCQTACTPDQAENLRCLGHKQDLSTGFTQEQRAWEWNPARTHSWLRAGANWGQGKARVRSGSWRSRHPTLRPERRAEPGDFLFPGLPLSLGLALSSERPSAQADPARSLAAYLTRPRPPGRPAGSGKPPGGEA